MIIKYKSNLVAGIAAIILSIILVITIPGQIAVETVVNFGITSRSLPYGMAAIIAVCGIGLVFQSLVLKKDKEKSIKLSGEIAPYLLFVAFGIYIFTFDKEWLLSTIALSCVTLVLSKCKKWYYYVIVTVLAVAVYFVFVNILHIRLQSIIF